MSTFDLKSRLGGLVGDCSTYKAAEQMHEHSSGSEWEENDLIEPGRALTEQEISALMGSRSVSKE